MIETALKYASQGWPVFPCQPPKAGDKDSGKLPLTTHGHKDASTDPDQITAWWTRWPSANIGIPTGKASGIVVIDADGEQGLANLGGLKLPATLTSRTGSGGLHLLYNAGDHGVRNTQGRLAQNIDTRGEGGYIIAPGSVHWTGAVYAWEDETADVANLPQAVIDKLKPVPVKIHTPAARPHESDVLARASAYLATMDPAIQGSGGHNALYAAATAMAHGFSLTRQEALQLLSSEYNPRCVPPWDLSKARDRKEFERKVDQALKEDHDQPRGWLRDAQIDQSPEDQALVESGRQMAHAMLARNARRLLKELGVQTEPEPLPRMAPWLLNPPGLVGRVAGWINATAYMPQPELSLANALAFVGTLAGRKVRTETDLRSNLYCLGVGDSGCGKDHSRKAIKRLVKACGLTEQMLGGEDVSSDAAILGAVHRQPSILFQFDEIGHFFAAAKSANAATFTRMIPVTLTKLFSSANTAFLGKEYAGEVERKDIDSPNVCMYGTTVPGRFYQGITPDEIRDGFLGRMLVFASSDPDPDPQDVPTRDVPAQLVEDVVAWWQWRPDPPEGTGNLAAVTGTHPAVVRCDSDAQGVFLSFREHCRAMKKKHRGGQGLDALWARAGEHAAKVAMVVSLDKPGEGLYIGGEAARYACELVDWLVTQFIVQIEDQVGANEFDRERLRVAKVIREAGEITMTELYNATRGIMPRTRKEILSELAMMGYVTMGVTPTSTKPITKLKWTGK